MDDVVARCKQNALDATEYFLKTFSFVPDDKLTWSPSPTAKSALRIAAHTAVYAGVFAQVLRDGKWRHMEIAQHQAAVNVAEEAVTTREAAVELLRTNTDAVLAALDAVTPERMASTVETPAFPAPFTFLMTIPAGHVDGHACQIDYLQTCWGDHEVHF